MSALKRFKAEVTSENGFSVVEILVSMVIILLLAVVLTPLVVFTAQSNQHNRAKLTAKNLANEVIEEIRSLEFADIGLDTTGADPAGSLPGSRTVTVDNRSYTIETFVNWEDQSSCLSGANAEWDVKIARVKVTTNGFFQGGNVDIEETIETLISRDSEQPLLTGANIRVCVFRGWDYAVSSIDADGEPVDETDRDYVPVEWVEVEITGPATRTTLTTAKGSALFVGLAAGEYDVAVSRTGMVVFPGSYPSPVTAANNSTAQKFAFVEYPAAISLQLKDADNIPVVIPASSFSGSLTLEQPYGSDIVKGFSMTGSTGVVMPENLFNGLWPFPEEHANAYVFKDVSIPGYLVHLKGFWDIVNDESWRGYFEGPDTVKSLIVYLWKIPDVDDTFAGGGDWLIEESVNINYEISPRIEADLDTYVLKSGVFNRDKSHTSLSLAADKTALFLATNILSRGNELEILNNSILNLHTNYLHFENEITIRASGAIILNVLKSAPHDDDFDLLLWPDDAEYLIDENNVKIPLTDLQRTVKGSDIEIPGGFSGFDTGSSWNSVDYGLIYLEKDVYMGPSGNRELIVSKGAYYFPDSYNFNSDWGKAPQDGGLIMIAN